MCSHKLIIHVLKIRSGFAVCGSCHVPPTFKDKDVFLVYGCRPATARKGGLSCHGGTFKSVSAHLRPHLLNWSHLKTWRMKKKHRETAHRLFIPTEESPPAGHEEECSSDWPKQKKPCGCKSDEAFTWKCSMCCCWWTGDKPGVTCDVSTTTHLKSPHTSKVNDKKVKTANVHGVSLSAGVSFSHTLQSDAFMQEETGQDGSWVLLHVSSWQYAAGTPYLRHMKHRRSQTACQQSPPQQHVRA